MLNSTIKATLKLNEQSRGKISTFLAT